MAPGCFFLNAANSSGSHNSSSEQPAARSGITTVLSGFNIFAVSAIKSTPAKAMTFAPAFFACLERPSESPT